MAETGPVLHTWDCQAALSFRMDVEGFFLLLSAISLVLCFAFRVTFEVRRASDIAVYG